MRRTKLAWTTVGVIAAILVSVAATALLRLGPRGPEAAPEKSGAELFQQQGCIQCHYPDRTEKKIGPGLKGVLHREKLQASGDPATRENVKKQIVAPYDKMPSYQDRLSDQELQRLVDYLATL